MNSETPDSTPAANHGLASQCPTAVAARLTAQQRGALGFAWAYACVLLGRGVDPRTYEVTRMADDAARHLTERP